MVTEFKLKISLPKDRLCFGLFEKNSRTRKLKPQENNSKLKQKTQGFGKVWKIKYKY